MHVSIIGKSCSATYIADQQLAIPLFLDRVPAGFPSPAQDYVEQTLDLNELCIKHPAVTFLWELKATRWLKQSLGQWEVWMYVLYVRMSQSATLSSWVSPRLNRGHFGSATTIFAELHPRINEAALTAQSLTVYRSVLLTDAIQHTWSARMSLRSSQLLDLHRTHYYKNQKLNVFLFFRHYLIQELKRLKCLDFPCSLSQRLRSWKK